MQKRAGIYVHIPFCERKCTYCNFNTTDYSSKLSTRYIDAVIREIAWWGEALDEARGSIEFDTIYIGGGTPSIIDAEDLAALIAACRRCFHIAGDTEITIEINPASISRDKLERWLTAGINRASVGVQSFIDRELVSLSRTHTADEARRTIELLREAGFQNLSLDLIAGLPEQTLTDWEFNLSQALSMNPEHLSLYMLDLKEGTQLFAQLKRGLRPQTDDDLTAEMYRMISSSTEAAGYEHYEISNFARVSEDVSTGHSQFRSRHNLKYWTGASFYGIGCGAHSYDGWARWFNVLRTEAYIEKVLTAGNAIAERNDLSEIDRAAEALFMGLRLKEGVGLEDFAAEYGVNVVDRYRDELPRLADAGLIEIGAGRLSLTPAGRLLSNEVFVSFI